MYILYIHTRNFVSSSFTTLQWKRSRSIKWFDMKKERRGDPGNSLMCCTCSRSLKRGPDSSQALPVWTFICEGHHCTGQRRYQNMCGMWRLTGRWKVDFIFIPRHMWPVVDNRDVQSGCTVTESRLLFLEIPFWNAGKTKVVNIWLCFFNRPLETKVIIQKLWIHAAILRKRLSQKRTQELRFLLVATWVRHKCVVFFLFFFNS